MHNENHNCEETRAALVPWCQLQYLIGMGARLAHNIQHKNKKALSERQGLIQDLVNMIDKLYFTEFGANDEMIYTRVKNERLIMLRKSFELLVYKEYLSGYLSDGQPNERNGLGVAGLAAFVLGCTSKRSNTSLISRDEVMKKVLWMIGQEDPGNEVEVKR